MIIQHRKIIVDDGEALAVRDVDPDTAAETFRPPVVVEAEFEDNEEQAATAGRLPPHDLEAEAACLSAVMIDSQLAQHGRSVNALAKLDFLHPEMFFSEAHAQIFKACREVVASGLACDIVTVATYLKKEERIAQVGGMAYLTEVLNAAPAVSNVTSYGQIVHDRWRARRVIEVTRELSVRGYYDYGTTQAYADEAMRVLSAIAAMSVGQSLKTNTEDLQKIMTEVQATHQLSLKGQKITGTPTGIPGLDAMINGLHNGDKTEIVALPGRGKTALACQIAVNVALQGIGVLYFCTEMQRIQLLYRLVSMFARIDSRRLKTGAIQEEEWPRFFEAIQKIGTLPLWFDDTPSITITHIRTATRSCAERAFGLTGFRLGLFVVDYVQKTKPSAETMRKQRHEQINEVSDGTKNLARELKIPCIELAQSKPIEVDPKTGKRPKPTEGNVEGSNQIERDCDNLYYLYRNPKYSPTGKILGENPNSISLLINKQRGGDVGELLFEFDRPHSYFECVDGQSQGE